jgi:large subunit ribosomal protein L29
MDNAIQEIRKKDDAGLRDELAALRQEQFKLRMAAASGQPARPDQHGKVRRNIARVKTVMKQRRSAK